MPPKSKPKTKKPKSKLNVKLLRKVQKFLLDEPRRFDMGDWISPAENSDVLEEPPCGTACCLAGAAYILVNKIDLGNINCGSVENVSVVAKEKLGLKSDNLFYVENWPMKYFKQYDCATTPEDRAKAGVGVIDYLIKHGSL